MIKEILVCLEGSPSSDAALRTAMTIAGTLPATLVGLAVVDEPDIRAGAAVGIGGSAFKHERDDALVADAHQRAAEWLGAFERRCRDAHVSARSLEIVGRPTDSILEETDKHDLTVLGRDANFRFETNADDSRTREAILHKATRPVLVVPENVTGLGTKVVIAYDGSGAAKRAIATFAASGLAAGREVFVATVDDSGAQAWEMASRAVAMLKEAGVPSTPHNIVSTLANVDALFMFADKVGAGLMVMGSFAHSRLQHLFHGSATRGIIEKTTIPIYLQH
jgi:nucleotide-binding universal stress UspA family protein